ncbi:MAG: sulfite exporter TauE/SafE family protein [Proteobacteria bacterium]|nr:sulfite exporter TauE/SafE family protein [Pseudomonadota bacterium]
MFEIYLPIAEMSMNLLVILGMGGAVGFLSGMFGVGGGFLMTPLLIFAGIPTAVAVATEANQIVASSVSGALAQWRRGNVDFKMGAILLAGGMAGAVVGVQFVKLLRQTGQVDLIISLSYVTFLGIIGSLMLIESARAILRARAGKRVSARKPGQHNWIHGLPFKMRFKRSKLYISAIPPLVIGAFVGLLAAIMGVGGGFIMVPAMIYLLRVPTSVVIGTSLFQIIFVTSTVTILHAATNQTVDVLLAVVLMVGGVIGAQMGARAGQHLKGEQLRALLAIMVLGVSLRLLFGLVVEPDELFSIGPEIGGQR